MTTVRKPFGWMGGKSYLVKRLLSMIPPHRIYCEVFGGSAALLFSKPPSEVEIYNDIDSDLVNFFRVLQNPDQFELFYWKVSMTPFSREEFYRCRDTLHETTDPVERAYRWYIVARQSFGGDFVGRKPSWGYTVRTSRRGMALSCSHYLSAIELLTEFRERVMRVQIEHDDFRNIFPRFDTPETFFYVDPPYVLENRRGGQYAHEMSLEDHQALVQHLLSIRGMAILSGYDHPVYDPLVQAGWSKTTVNVPCRVAGRTRQTELLGDGALEMNQRRIETIWVSPTIQSEHEQWKLHFNS